MCIILMNVLVHKVSYFSQVHIGIT